MGGGIELETGFSRLLKMTANIDVKFTVPDDVNVKSSLKMYKLERSIWKNTALATSGHALFCPKVMNVRMLR